MPTPGNRVYIAGKLGLMEETIQRVKKELEARGYVIIYDWTTALVPKPLRQHVRAANDAAAKMAQAVLNADIVIVFFSEGGKGLWAEFGGALITSNVLKFIHGVPAKRILAVGQGNEDSIFCFHEDVERLPDVEALYKELPPLAHSPPA